MIKTAKEELLLQFISLLPISFFIYFYMEEGYRFIFAPLPLLLWAYNFYSYRQKREIFHYPLLLILRRSFLLYSFYGLGSREAPQKFERFDNQNPKIIFTLEKREKFNQFAYYSGIDDNSKFRLEYWDQGSWKKLYTYDKNFPFSFQWNRIDINETVASKVRLSVTQGSLMLGEVRFLQDGKALSLKSEKPLLTDDKEIRIDTSYYGGMFFDEIYHGRTAYELIHGLRIYETTHPYLGKWLIAGGIKLFGMTPFGWRVVNVLFATLFIVMAYLFGLKLFREEYYALGLAWMVTYSFMHYTQAHIALIDTFGVLFIFISYYFLYRFIVEQRRSLILWSGLFFGLASGIKWSAAFASIGFLLIAIYLLWSKYPLKKEFAGYRLILYGLLSYVLLAVGVYFLTFFDIYFRTGSFQAIIDYQINMYNYHSVLQATHPYSSPWWSWVLDMKPMCYYREVKDGIFSSMTVFGNPALFWMGLLSILYLFFVIIRRRTLEATFILLAFLGLYLPYIFVGRLMFIYHYYYAVPFMFLATVYLWRDLISYSPKFVKLFLLFLIGVMILFLMFYPVLSGHTVPKSYVDNYLVWFSGWWL